MKDINKICKGCKYLSTRTNGFNTCDYMLMTGHSRLKLEIEKGGYVTNKCDCKDNGKKRKRKKITSSNK